jgi:hypothetical protein
MKVAELIKALEQMPEDADVKYFWDSKARTPVTNVYWSRNGDVVLSDGDEQSYCIEEHDMPQRYAT